MVFKKTYTLNLTNPAALKDAVDKKLLISKSAYPTGIGRVYTESVDDAEIA